MVTTQHMYVVPGNIPLQHIPGNQVHYNENYIYLSFPQTCPPSVTQSENVNTDFERM